MSRPGDTAPDDDLLLALLNTTPVREGRPTDDLARDDDAAPWAREHGGVGSPAEVDGLRRVRAVLQAAVRGEAGPGAAESLLERIRTRPALEPSGLVWVLEVPDDERLAARAVLAWARLQGDAAGRLRPCGNDECRLFLLDRTRANTARWCSMASCGNRMKARRHYQRRQAADPAS